MKQVNLYEAKTDLSEVRPPRKFNLGMWNHYGWSPPDDFDDPDPEIEELFYGDGTV
jgi:hypothetical protein